MIDQMLRKLLARDGIQNFRKLFSVFDDSLTIIDQEGEVILGQNPVVSETNLGRTPVRYSGEAIGWVISQKNPAFQSNIASFLEFWLAKESEKRNLAAEVLNNYRELNLFYRFSEKLVASLKKEDIAQMALDEICPLIKANRGYVALYLETSQELKVIARKSQQEDEIDWLNLVRGFVEHILENGVAEISNQHIPELQTREGAGSSVSVLCAPLKTEKRMLGVVLLIQEDERQFTAGDLMLVNAIALQTAPAIEIAFLHQLELEKARLERDLQVARRVQAGLLPQSMPTLDGWQIAALWQPARMVSGDLYDFLRFNNGKLGIVIADVTDKGVPAALIMANTRSILRAVVSIANRSQLQSPGRLLHRVNRILHHEIPLGMFVTCLLVILDPVSGKVTFSNAGHNLPYHRTPQGIIEPQASGAPLGVFPNSSYDDHELVIQPGESLFMYSDGLPEAHNSQGEMFDYWRLRQILTYSTEGAALNGEALLHKLMEQLALFAGPDWEQEDDVTMVTLERFQLLL
jgi:serine phosphatase RsbU (regulator of sigma subunit)